MYKRAAVVLLAFAVLTTCLAVGLARAEGAKPQTKCPVNGDPIDKKVHIDYQGQRIYFCCPKCIPEFRKDPEKYFAKIAADGVQLENIQTTCPVSGEKLGEGDMGAPVSLQYKGRTVMFCCKMCIAKFEKEPAKYLAKLPGEQPPAK
jgi:YHS domain-containing protein